jgi:hypothetical protein
VSPGLRSEPLTDAPRFELRALAWERVQVTLWLRAADGDLPDPIRPWLEKVAAFATRHFAHLDGGSTDRVIDLALGR